MMIVMCQDDRILKQASEDLGMPTELLLSPLAKLAGDAADDQEWFSIDNGAFNGFRAKAFESLLKRNWRNRERCRWVAFPDVVGSARRTLELFDHWRDRLQSWPRALVAQDGLEEFPIPWRYIACLFIGGSTDWKLGIHAEQCIRAAQAMGKWVHVGRVNTAKRIEKFMEMGVDSIDGTGLIAWPEFRRLEGNKLKHPTLFESNGEHIDAFSTGRGVNFTEG